MGYTSEARRSAAPVMYQLMPLGRQVIHRRALDTHEIERVIGNCLNARHRLWR
jgi:hypothetical protein